MIRLSLIKDIEGYKTFIDREIDQLRVDLKKAIEELKAFTKNEIEQQALNTQKQIEELRGEIERTKLSLLVEIEKARVIIIKCISGLLLLQTGLILTIIKLVFKV